MVQQSDSQQTAPQAVNLVDYKPTPYQIDSVELNFDLYEVSTTIKSTLSIRRHKDQCSAGKTNVPLELHGEDLVLKSVIIDGNALTTDDYTVSDKMLTINVVPDNFLLQIETEINPASNTSLNGLYTSGGNFCTQCEAEGFRRITYMYDRPDVMARYTTTISAEKAKYPVLLSNGNLVASGYVDTEKTRHWATWQDPHPKPTYLFALVAGDLSQIEDQFVTQSGREVTLHIYVQSHNIDKCDHAMLSLKKAMKWDEQVYGREYDLDVYMIVAVDDFNMGAMENKGLNVFNSKYVLAKPNTATDSDYESIEGVIGHEYFHNWSGNRVTCRDWFQLSLKEGFTVFRDQEFSADMSSRGVKRIQDVNILRAHQFREDASPMAHPIRPESYVEINNFYTVTVYNKGAEVVRMLHHLLGAEKFRKGTDLYFERHDGQAVTTDDFVKALEDASGEDFSLFRLWYRQAGTPELQISRHYDAATKTYSLHVEQSCPPTPGQAHKNPFQIPLAVGLLDKSGNDIALQLSGEEKPGSGTRVLQMTESSQDFVFVNVPEEPVPSLLRGFSAPVKVNIALSDQERCFLMAHDSDDFNRWDAGQQFAVKLIVQLVDDYHNDRELVVPDDFIGALQKNLQNVSLDKSLIAQAINLPSESYISEFVNPIDPVAIHQVRRFVRESIAKKLSDVLSATYLSLSDDSAYTIDQASINRRALKNTCLGYLMELNDNSIIERCYQQFVSGNNMTDVMAALCALANTECQQGEQALQQFYQQWKNDALVVDKWLALQASSRLPGTLKKVKALTQHEAFSITNPNKVRALIGAFGHGNPAQFHDASGVGYAFLTDYIIKLDALNPQISARLTTVYTTWRKYDVRRQDLLRLQLEKIITTPDLSRDVYEIISKSLS
ncbi:MAG: aminopeptidase N [Gammaproteobacteria bacterium]|nr:aminopeptidase N [Gammaproteobacteria bacterium]